MTIKIVVAGCRNYTNYEEAKEFISNILIEFPEDTDFIIFSGKSRGADKLGELYANEMNYKIKFFPALWDKYGRAAGPKRNEEMAKQCDLVICFWDGESRGTKSMISLAKKYNKPIKLKIISPIN